MKIGSVLLIDEFGLYLYVVVQEDFLNMFNKFVISSFIVIFIYSYWLMDFERLERIRLVLKNNDCIYVENKIYKGVDNNIMKLIFFVIGLGFKNNISIFGKNVIFVEGYFDYYYLEVMRYYFFEMYEYKFDNFKIYFCLGFV